MERTISLANITADDYEPLVNSTFLLDRGNGTESGLTLVSVTRLGHGAAGRRPPFSLEFHGTPGEVLPQRIYSLKHEELGAQEIFLVPVGASVERTQYEAIFT
jgi:hypothetical protein